MGERADRVGGALPLELPGPEERLPPAARAWLDPAQPLPPNVHLIALREAEPVGGPLAAALLLGGAAGALGVMGAQELQANRLGGAITAAALLSALLIAALRFAQRATQRIGARLGGGRRARQGLLLGEIGGEAVLLVRLRAGEALLLGRARVLDVALEQPRGAPRPSLRLRVGPDLADARELLLEGAPDGGAEAALATLRAWRAAPSSA